MMQCKDAYQKADVRTGSSLYEEVHGYGPDYIGVDMTIHDGTEANHSQIIRVGAFLAVFQPGESVLEGAHIKAHSNTNDEECGRMLNEY